MQLQLTSQKSLSIDLEKPPQVTMSLAACLNTITIQNWEIQHYFRWPLGSMEYYPRKTGREENDRGQSLATGNYWRGAVLLTAP